MSLKTRTYELLEPGKRKDSASNLIDMLILGLILVNVSAMILETVEDLSQQFQAWFDWIEVITVAVFR